MNVADFTIYLCNFLCIIPPITCHQSQTTKKIQKCWAVLAITIISAIFGTSTYYRINGVYDNMDGTISFLDQLSQTSFSFTNLVATIEITFFSKNFQDFFENLNRNSDTKNDWMKSLENLNFFLIFNVTLLITLIWDMVFWWTNQGFGSYILYSLRSLEFYQNGLNVYLLVCICDALRRKFKNHNEKLQQFMEIQKNEDSYKLQDVENLRKLRQIQNDLLDLVPLFNGVFGRNILLLIFNCIVNTILYTSIAIVCLMRKNDFVGIEPNIWLFITCTCWILESLAFPVMLATVCERSVAEADKIVTISITYLNEIPTLPKTEKMQNIKEDLQMLCQQAQAKKPCFTAAGFFLVDHTMLGMMIGSVTSYIIVVLQFAK